MSQKTTSRRTNKSNKLPIFLMVWPVVGMLVSILGYVVASALFATIAPGGDDLFGTPSPLQSFFSIVSFLLGGVSVLLGPISFIIGLVLIITNNKK